MTGATAEKLLTAEELAERWRIPGKKPQQGIYRLVRENAIPPGAVVKLNRYVRFRLEGIEQFERNGGGLADA